MKIIQDNPCIVYSENLGKTYTLYRTTVKFLRSKPQTIYYFSASEQNKHNSMGYDIEAVAIPNGWQIVENPRNGFITIKEIKHE